MGEGRGTDERGEEMRDGGSRGRGHTCLWNLMPPAAMSPKASRASATCISVAIGGTRISITVNGQMRRSSCTCCCWIAPTPPMPPPPATGP